MPCRGPEFSFPCGPYFVECDYDTFNFILTADDVKEATAATGVAVKLSGSCVSPARNACNVSGVADQCSGIPGFLTDGDGGFLSAGIADFATASVSNPATEYNGDGVILSAELWILQQLQSAIQQQSMTAAVFFRRQV